MFQINGKTFMNLQEAVQWLLDNNALPFQSSANYVANTEIGMGTIVNPSPAKVRIGSLIFFADSKVSTVIGLTENGFICSDQYNNLVDDIAYVTGVSINGSGRLITTLSDGQTIDAGIVKQVSGFSINASQHLIVSYNDGTSTDLGAIFSGNVNISGTLNATAITGDSIIENTPSGLHFNKTSSDADFTINYVYAGAVKNGNKLTLVLALNITKLQANTSTKLVGTYGIPASILNKIYPTTIGGYSNAVAFKNISAVDTSNNVSDFVFLVTKTSGGLLFNIQAQSVSSMTLNTKYYIRMELTLLLSENLAS